MGGAYRAQLPRMDIVPTTSQTPLAPGRLTKSTFQNTNRSKAQRRSGRLANNSLLKSHGRHILSACSASRVNPLTLSSPRAVAALTFVCTYERCIEQLLSKPEAAIGPCSARFVYVLFVDRPRG